MADQLKTLLKHSSVYSIGTIIGQLVGFLLLPLYTRYLTPLDYGVASIVEITTSFISVIVGWGILDAMTRFYQEYDDEEKKKLVISTVFWIILLMSVFSWLTVHLSASLLSYGLFANQKYTELFKIAAVGLSVGFFSDAGMRYLMIKKMSLTYVIISVFNLIFSVVLNILFVAYLNLGIMGIYYSAVLTRSIVSIVLLVPIVVNVGINFSLYFAKKFIRFSIPLIISGMATIATKESDKFFINHFFSPIETGVYAIANKIGFTIHLMITSPFMQGYNPSRFEIAKQDNAQELYSKIFYYYVLLISTGGLVLSVLSEEIIGIMTTSEYFAAGRYIPLVVLSWIFAGIRCHIESGILISYATKYIAYISGGTGILTFAMNWLLIGKFGVLGALVVLNVTQLVAVLASYIIAQKLFPIKFHFTRSVKVIGVGILCYISSTLLKMDNILISILFKCIVITSYFAILRMMGLIDGSLVRAGKGVFFERFNRIR